MAALPASVALLCSYVIDVVLTLGGVPVPTGSLVALLAFALYLMARRDQAGDMLLSLVAITVIVGVAVDLAGLDAWWRIVAAPISVMAFWRSFDAARTRVSNTRAQTGRPA